MSKAKHTPGPWRYVYAPGYCGELRAQNGTTIAEFVTEPNSDNACLIAAAPELLAALIAITTTRCDGMDITPINDAWDMATAAIAKATGGAA